MKFALSSVVVNEIYLTPEEKEDAYENARYGAVSYIPPLSILILLSSRKESKFARFHAKQAFIITLIMLFGFIFSGWLLWTIEAITWAIALFGFFFAAQGRYVAIPGIIQLLSLHVVKETEATKMIKEARKDEEAKSKK